MGPPQVPGTPLLCWIRCAFILCTSACTEICKGPCGDPLDALLLTLLVPLAQHQFHDRVAQLIYTFPESATTSTGGSFWSAPKRFPTPLVFDTADASHVSLVQAAAILKAQLHNISTPAWASDPAKVCLCSCRRPDQCWILSEHNGAQVAEAAARVDVPAFQPQKGVQIETDPKATSVRGGGGDDEGVIEALIQQLEVRRIS